MTAVLLGIPQSYVKRAKAAIAKSGRFVAWTFEYLPTTESRPAIPAKAIDRLENLVGEHDDVHLLGLSNQPDRQDLVAELRRCFRFRWFGHKTLGTLASSSPEPFLARLAADLAEEVIWAQQIKPMDLKSALLLPENCFDTHSPHDNLWRAASSFGDQENIRSAKIAIERFGQRYFRRADGKTRWIDRNDRIFDHQGQRHGVAPFPRDRKFSFRFEMGFHYDVTSLDGRQFNLRVSNSSRTVPAEGYLNVDPHGEVR